MKRVYNFGAGPAMLPEEILSQAQEELLNWKNSGMSVMEISHRSDAFSNLMSETEQALRTLLSIPSHYHILFLSSPARAQFSMIPMNLLGHHKNADYIETGIWSKISAQEAQRYAEINIAASSASSGYNSVPDVSTWKLSENPTYVYFTHNETINGVIFSDIPEVGNVPLVTDMTSSLLTQPIDVSRYGLIFAGSQKNMGPAGLTLVIIRDDLVKSPMSFTPTIFNYQFLIEQKSLYYTPNSFSIYMANLMFKWLIGQGGIEKCWEQNQRKSKMLYDFIDSNDFYINSVKSKNRSHCNIIFQLENSSLTAEFLSQALKANLAALKGHRLLGGMRVSLYNAMPIAGVESLIAFMQSFAKRYG